MAHVFDAVDPLWVLLPPGPRYDQVFEDIL